MADYRTPLPALFAATLETAINRALALDTTSPQRLKRLQGRLLRVDLEGLGIELFLTFEYGSVLVSVNSERAADTVISGSPIALFMMAAPDEVGEWGLADSGVRIQGDANLARDLGNVFSQMDLDWEGPLNAILGDTLGFQLASGLRQGLAAAKTAAQSTAGQVQDFLRREQGPVVAKPEMREFSRDVRQLNQQLDRLEKRLQQLEGETG